MAMDSKKNIWVGTDLGLSKFDGKNWTNYNMIDGKPLKWVYALTIDKLDHKWLGTNHDGVWMFDDNQWINYKCKGLDNYLNK